MNKIMYLCSFFINNQFVTSNEINKLEDTVDLIQEDVFKKEIQEVIKDKIDIDLDFLMNAKKEVIVYYLKINIIIWIIIVIISLIFSFFKINRYNIVANYFNVENDIVLLIPRNYINNHVKKNIIFLILMSIFEFCFFCFKLIIISIVSFLLININYKKKYIKYNSLFQICLIHTCIALIYIFVTTKDWDLKDFNFLESCKIWKYQCPNCLNKGKKVEPLIHKTIKAILTNLIFNNLALITSYYMLKRYYQANPMKYQEKRDYINSLKNVVPITPIEVLDCDLDNNL
jgi:hypothetical protein